MLHITTYVLFPTRSFCQASSLYLPIDMSTPISSPPAYSHILKTCLQYPNKNGKTQVGMFLQKKTGPFRHVLRCNCSSKPGDSAPGENESKQVLDAFFLGKAFAEALNERIESTVGELLSTVGRLQAEQQRQVQEFQDEVLERAKKAKEKAAREAIEAQGLVPKSTASSSSSPTVSEPKNASAAVDEPTSLSSSGSNDQSPNNGSTDPLIDISVDD